MRLESIYAADARCAYVGPGPFCARCGHPWWMHRAIDERCPKYTSLITPAGGARGETP